MTPAELTAASFAGYPPQGREIAVAHVAMLRQIPLAVLPSFLVQLKAYDWKFPKEQRELVSQLDWLTLQLQGGPGSVPSLAELTGIRLSPALEQTPWAADPAAFIDALAEYLWQTQQIDLYHRAGGELYGAMSRGTAAALDTNRSKKPMLVIAVIGRDAPRTNYPVFEKLRPMGLYVRNLGGTAEGAKGNAGSGISLEPLMELLAARAASDPAPYAHWYIDGGEPWALHANAQADVSAFSYPQLAPITDAVLQAMDRAVQQGSGPEMLERTLGHMEPQQLGAAQVTSDARLQHFYVSLLTRGSGTQIYSTSFLQAAACEVLRRAQPSTLCFRFAPRRRQASLNDILDRRALSAQTDASGSLIDADMGSYYAYLQMKQLAGSEQATFLGLVESGREAIVIGPSITRGVASDSSLTLPQLLAMATS